MDHKVSYAELKTEGYYSRVLNHNVLLLYNGEMDQGEFVDELARLIDEQFRRAWRAGAEDVGVEQDKITEDDWQPLEDRILAEYDYVDAYAADIASAAEQGRDIKPYQDRVDMWSGRYREVQDEARIYFSKGTGQMFEWVYGDTVEHCADCERLSGTVANADDWAASGWQPQSRDLECGGWNCQCRLEPTDKPKSEGGIP
jgi:hypothetical protein